MRCSRCDRIDGTHEPGCGEQPKTAEEAFDDVKEAWRGLVDAVLEASLDVVRALQIDKLVAWLEARLR